MRWWECGIHRRALPLAMSLLGLMQAVGACCAAVRNGAPGQDATLRLASEIEALPRDKHGALIRLGHEIFTNTPTKARRFSGNALSCSNCHLDAGTRAGAAPMWAAWGMYPAYVAKADKVVTFEERIQQCFRFSMNGFPPPLDSEEIRALSVYSQWLARGRPVGVELPGRNFPTLARTGSDPNPLRGREIYAQRCAACHGGQGQGAQDAQGRSMFPPLWGPASFNKGAGFTRTELLAGFLKVNMPLDKPDLSDQEAFDLAAWINVQFRMPDPRRGLLSWLIEP